MNRVLAVLMVVAALGVTGSGCCVCRAPYDYCGPTFSGCGDECWSHARAGSAFTGARVQPEPEPMPVAPPAEELPREANRQQPDA